jgi:hypothetical protein
MVALVRRREIAAAGFALVLAAGRAWAEPPARMLLASIAEPTPRSAIERPAAELERAKDVPDLPPIGTLLRTSYFAAPFWLDQEPPAYRLPVLALRPAAGLTRATTIMHDEWARSLFVIPDPETFQRFASGFTIGIALAASIGGPLRTRFSTDAPMLPSPGTRFRELARQYGPIAARWSHESGRTVVGIQLPSISLRFGWML